MILLFILIVIAVILSAIAICAVIFDISLGTRYGNIKNAIFSLPTLAAIIAVILWIIIYFIT